VQTDQSGVQGLSGLINGTPKNNNINSRTSMASTPRINQSISKIKTNDNISNSNVNIKQLQELFVVMQQQLKREKEEIFKNVQNLKDDDKCPYCERKKITNADNNLSLS